MTIFASWFQLILSHSSCVSDKTTLFLVWTSSCILFLMINSSSTIKDWTLCLQKVYLKVKVTERTRYGQTGTCSIRRPLHFTNKEQLQHRLWWSNISILTSKTEKVTEGLHPDTVQSEALWLESLVTAEQWQVWSKNFQQYFAKGCWHWIDWIWIENAADTVLTGVNKWNPSLYYWCTINHSRKFPKTDSHEDFWP